MDSRVQLCSGFQCAIKCMPQQTGSLLEAAAGVRGTPLWFVSDKSCTVVSIVSTSLVPVADTGQLF
jgi:hypothetical protein